MPVNPLSLVVKLEGRSIPLALFKPKGTKVFWARFSLWELGQLRVSLKTADLRTAKDAARLAVFAAERKAKEKPASETYTLSQALAEFFGPGGHGAAVSKRTRSGYTSVLKDFSALIGGETDLSALDTDAVFGSMRGYIAALVAKSFSACTIRNHVKTLAVFFREVMRSTGPDAKLRTRWAFNPAEKSRHKLAKAEEPKRVQILPDERAALLKVVENYSCWPAVLLCLGAGFRPAEACATIWGDVTLFPRPVTEAQAKRNHYGIGAAYSYKTKKRRTVPLTKWVADGLGVLWTDETIQGGAVPEAIERVLSLNKYNAFRSLRAAVKAAGISEASAGGVTFQAMRRTFASELSAKLPRNYYSRIMGHDLATGEKHYIQGKDVLEAIDFSVLER